MSSQELRSFRFRCWFLLFVIFNSLISYCLAQFSLDSVWFSEETGCDGQNLVHICYILSGSIADISIQISADSGASWINAGSGWFVTLLDTVGDLGSSVTPGTHCFYWLMSNDRANEEGDDYFTKVDASGLVFDLSDTNLICNGSFEQGFFCWDTRGVCNIDPVAHIGDSSFHIQTFSEGQYIFQNWPLVEEISYYLEFYARFDYDSTSGVLVEVIRDWDPLSGYALRGTLIAFRLQKDSIQFSAWDADTMVYYSFPLFVWNKISVFADVSVRDQTLYVNDEPLVTLHSDTSYTAQWILAGAVSGHHDNYANLYFDDFLLTYLESNPYVMSDTATGPLDTRGPQVVFSCLDTLATNSSMFFSWTVNDLFWRGAPCSLRISCCLLDTVMLVSGTSFNWVAPSVGCLSCTAIVAARDSFCNWGYDTCIFVVVAPLEANLVCPVLGVTSACAEQEIIFGVQIDCGVDSGSTYIVVDSTDTFRLGGSPPHLEYNGVDTLKFVPGPGYWESGPHWFKLHIEDNCGQVYDEFFGLLWEFDSPKTYTTIL